MQKDGGSVRADDPGGVFLPARSIPTPVSISAEAQACLAALERLSHLRPPWPEGSDAETWRQAISAANAHFGPAMAGMEDLPILRVDEEQVAGRALYVAVPPDAPDGYVYLDIHGGGLVALGGDPCRLMGRRAATTTGLATYSIDYRMPPDDPYPAGLDDCIAAYRHLLDRHDAARIMVGGVSAGGNLAAALALRARDEGLPLPAGLLLLTPELDLTESGDSFQTLRGLDVVQPQSYASANALYAGRHPLDHPYVSPLFGDVSAGFPPTFLQAGTRDLFLSNAVRFHRTLRRHGMPAELHVFEGMPHGGFGGAPEDQDVADEVRRFVAVRLGLR